MSRKIPEKRGQKKVKKPLTFGQKCVIGGPNENHSHLDMENPYPPPDERAPQLRASSITGWQAEDAAGVSSE